MVLLVIRVLLFLSLALSIYMIVVTMERCRSEKRYNFIYCLVTLFLYTLGYFIEMTCGTLEGGIIAIKVMYAGGCFMSAFFFFFVADYCEIKLKKKYYLLPLLIVPVLNFLVAVTFEFHTLLYASFLYDPSEPLQGMQIKPGSLYIVSTIYSLFCIGLSCFVLLRTITKRRKGSRFALILLLVSSLAPLIANILYQVLSYLFTTAVSGINFTAFVMVISNFIFYYNVLRNDLFDLAPKAYSITLDLIRDAFVVLDWDLRYTGANKNAFALFPGLGTLHKSAPIDELENWPAELSAATDMLEGAAAKAASVQECQFTLAHRPGSTYSGWINRVEAEDKSTLGWVILIQDITESVTLIRNIQSQRDEIAAMRDNLKEGLFLMDREFRIQPSYSRALENVLSGKAFQGRSFPGLLEKSFSTKDMETVRDYFTMIFDKSADYQLLEEINPLQEFAYTSMETGEQKTLRGLFAPVDQGGGEVFVLGTFQDITEEVKLRKQLAEEEARRQDEMRNLFELLQVDPKVFSDFIEDTNYEFDRINNMIKDKKLANKQLLINVYQSVHAIKSNSVIVGLKHYGEKLHALETEIKTLGERENIGFEDLLHITVELEKRMQEKNGFPGIIKRIRDFHSGEGEASKQDEDVFVEALSTACGKVAADEGKKAAFRVTSFDKESLLHGQRRAMKEILTQLVRNAVYHGIESPAEREAAGKDETGAVSLSVAVSDGRIRMILKDDGRGLDFEKIAQKAEERGMLKSPGEKNDKALLSNFIFMPGFSTSGSENMNAGRGIGLNLVRDRIRELNGTIKLHGAWGKGLVFDIQIPLAG